jgi:phosphoribosylformimino-5-aminoimidazole carboxamide ribotide isomerase
MILYPAIDIKDGKAVRLKQGKFDDVTVYFDDPVDAAHHWVDQGATWLHVVDLDGALEGKPKNTKHIERIMQEMEVPVQIGGGIRSREIAEIYHTLGAGRIVIGTKALEDPDLIKRLVAEFPEHLAIGIDAKDGFVAVRGWSETGTQKATDLAQQMQDIGVQHIIYTDISRDGMLTGPNFEALKIMAEQCSLSVIASGGIKDIEDVKKLKEMEGLGVDGAILGRSLYEGTLDLKEALAIA